MNYNPNVNPDVPDGIYSDIAKLIPHLTENKFYTIVSIVVAIVIAAYAIAACLPVEAAVAADSVVDIADLTELDAAADYLYDSIVDLTELDAALDYAVDNNVWFDYELASWIRDNILIR